MAIPANHVETAQCEHISRMLACVRRNSRSLLREVIGVWTVSGEGFAPSRASRRLPACPRTSIPAEAEGRTYYEPSIHGFEQEIATRMSRRERKQTDDGRE